MTWFLLLYFFFLVICIRVTISSVRVSSHSAKAKHSATRPCQAFGHPSGPSNRPLVAAKHPARTRHSTARRSPAFDRLSQPSIPKGIQPPVWAKQSAVCHSQAFGRLSRPSIPLGRGIQPLVAAKHSAVCHGQASCMCSCIFFFSSRYLVNLCSSFFRPVRWYTWICTCAPPVYAPSTTLISFRRYL